MSAMVIIMILAVVLLAVGLGWKHRRTVTIVTFSFTSMFLIVHGFAYMFGYFPTFGQTVEQLRAEDKELKTSAAFWTHIFLFSIGVTALFTYQYTKEKKALDSFYRVESPKAVLKKGDEESEGTRAEPKTPRTPKTKQFFA